MKDKMIISTAGELAVLKACVRHSTATKFAEASNYDNLPVGIHAFMRVPCEDSATLIQGMFSEEAEEYAHRNGVYTEYAHTKEELTSHLPIWDVLFLKVSTDSDLTTDAGVFFIAELTFVTLTSPQDKVSAVLLYCPKGVYDRLFKKMPSN